MKRGMPRKQLASLLGHKTTSQLCRWEEGSQLPNLCNALLLSHFLQMPVEFLFKELRNDLVRRTKHFQGTQHPIVQSLEPGEDWGWCYIDEVDFEGDELPPRG